MKPGSIWEGRGRGESDLARSEIISGLTALLLARGAEPAEIEQAVAEDRLDLLVIDYLLLPKSPRRTGYEVIETVGMDSEQADRLWRALGFAESHSASTFSDADVEALRTIRGLTEVGVATDETAVQVTRVLGSSMARFADALIAAADETAQREGVPAWVERPEDDGLRLAEALAFAGEIVLPSMEALIIYAWRRHIQAAARRRVSLRRSGAIHDPMSTEMTVGFADMVGFTALSSQLNATALARVVDRFEELAHGIVIGGGGRVVKMIGDEAMFVTEEPLRAVRIGLDLVDAYADDELLSDVRVGIATGPVLMREGDFFGAVVNRASRIVNIADAGTVLVSDEVHELISDDALDLDMEALKPRELKDIGRVVMWSIGRKGRVQPSDGRRTGVRWRRMSSLTAELEMLRSRGEQVFESLSAPRPNRD